MSLLRDVEYDLRRFRGRVFVATAFVFIAFSFLFFRILSGLELLSYQLGL